MSTLVSCRPSVGVPPPLGKPPLSARGAYSKPAPPTAAGLGKAALPGVLMCAERERRVRREGRRARGGRRVRRGPRRPRPRHGRTAPDPGPRAAEQPAGTTAGLRLPRGRPVAMPPPSRAPGRPSGATPSDGPNWTAPPWGPGSCDAVAALVGPWGGPAERRPRTVRTGPRLHGGPGSCDAVAALVGRFSGATCNSIRGRICSVR